MNGIGRVRVLVADSGKVHLHRRGGLEKSMGRGCVEGESVSRGAWGPSGKSVEAPLNNVRKVSLGIPTPMQSRIFLHHLVPTEGGGDHLGTASQFAGNVRHSSVRKYV